MKVRDVMSTDLEMIGPDASYKQAVEQLLARGVSGLPVVDATGNVVGIVTEADLIRRQGFAHRHRHRALSFVSHVLAGSDPYVVRRTEGLTVGDVMSQPVFAVSADDDLRDVARLMLQRRVKRMPVLDKGRMVGFVSRADLLRAFDRTDEDIEAAVHDALRPTTNDAVAVAVHDGVVTLTGTVRHTADVARVVGIAREIAGVVDVVANVAAPA